MRKLSWILITLLAFLGTAASVVAAVDNVTIITEVVRHGQVTSALVLDYGVEIDGTTLEVTDFSVIDTSQDRGLRNASRTIVDVYTSESVEIGIPTDSGRFVVLALDPENANSTTSFWSPVTRVTSPYELQLYVTQETDIVAADGSTVAGNAERRYASQERIDLIVQDFIHGRYEDPTTGDAINYRLYIPRDYDPTQEYPLVIFLHGAGERGDNNDVQLMANQGAISWATPAIQNENPAFVVAPQAPLDRSNWTDRQEDTNVHLLNVNGNLVPKLVGDLQESYSLDANRLYLTGLSQGGHGTWALGLAFPELWAAIVPVCGRGDDSAVAAMEDMPIWAFHSEDDPTVGVAGSRDLVSALRVHGVSVNYTEYPNGYLASQGIPGAHHSWELAYQTTDMQQWLFQQAK